MLTITSQHRTRRASCPARGITLIEILIVIAIIVILAAILFSLTGRMKEKAHSVKCMANLRQLAVVAIGAASDTGSYPPMLSLVTNSTGGLDHSGIIPFYGHTKGMECVMCPSAKYTGHDTKNAPITAYGGNPMVMVYQDNNVPPLVRPSQIARPGEVMLMGDSAQHGSPNKRAIGFIARWYGNRKGKPENSEKALTSAEIPQSGFWDPKLPLLPLRHNGRANIVFCDGHASSIGSIGELKEKNYYTNY